MLNKDDTWGDDDGTALYARRVWALVQGYAKREVELAEARGVRQIPYVESCWEGGDVLIMAYGAWHAAAMSTGWAVGDKDDYVGRIVEELAPRYPRARPAPADVVHHFYNVYPYPRVACHAMSALELKRAEFIEALATLPRSDNARKALCARAVAMLERGLLEYESTEGAWALPSPEACGGDAGRVDPRRQHFTSHSAYADVFADLFRDSA